MKRLCHTWVGDKCKHCGIEYRTSEAATEPYAYHLLSGGKSVGMFMASDDGENDGWNQFTQGDTPGCELIALYAAPPAASGQKLTDEQRVAIEAAIEISEEIKEGIHDGSFLSDVSIAALCALLSES